MNLVEYRILEVISIEEFPNRENMIVVTVKVDVWGNVYEAEHITDKEQWKRDLERGYYLA